jgi:cytidylate kinase
VAQAEQRQSFIRRLIDSIAFAGPGGGRLQPFGAVDPEGGFALAQSLEERLRGLIREVIEEVAGEGRAVIVAHAASMALARREGVLKVLVTASTEQRAERLVWAKGLEQAAAEAAVRNSDRERAGYFRRFYDLDQELPTHYDLVVNTDRLPPELAVAVIVAAAGSPPSADP